MSAKNLEDLIPKYRESSDFNPDQGVERDTGDVHDVDEPEPGSDDAIYSHVWQVLAETAGSMPGETGEFGHEISNGAVKITGSTYCASVYQRLVDAVPKIKAIQGVKSVDISAVRKL